jgi:serine protease Do
MKNLKYSLIAPLTVLLTVLPLACAVNGVSALPKADPPQDVQMAFGDFSNVVERVQPSVVAISTESVTLDSLNHAHTEQGAGSGWIIGEDGTIVTNNHVVAGATTVTVELSNHHAVTAEKVTTDAYTDVAVLKISPKEKLTALKVADTSKLKVGEWVMIIGNPLGMGISVKQGIISRLGVTMSSSPDQTYFNLIETSAAVNPGNSGGPMVNMNGEVIGITSLKIDASGIEGMGYAINIQDVMPVIDILSTGVRVIRPWLGVVSVGVDEGVLIQYRLSISQGALITGVTSGSPAAKAGISTGDVIIGIDKSNIAGDVDLNRIVNSSKIGQNIALTYYHKGDKKTVEVTLGQKPE